MQYKYKNTVWLQCHSKLEYNKMLMWIQWDYNVNTIGLQCEYNNITMWVQYHYNLSTIILQYEYSNITIWLQ